MEIVTTGFCVLVAQYVFLPLTLSGSFLGVLLGNTLYLVAAVAYFYITFLGYLGAAQWGELVGGWEGRQASNMVQWWRHRAQCHNKENTHCHITPLPHTHTRFRGSCTLSWLL